ncbi:MAG TPA: hypothetical protein VFN52_00510, partial [Acidiferrobacteraceae bacterium]|nr:hypothetical protein [Acidiferrobacteraceae bacterium]
LWRQGVPALAIADLAQANRIDPSRPQPLLLMMAYEYAQGHVNAAFRTRQRLDAQFRHAGVVARGLIAGYSPLEQAIVAGEQRKHS